MQPIPIATKKDYQATGENGGKFIIEPLFPGYGLTLGNALRRVLLSSLEGYAITTIRLKGAEHEFSNLDGVKEDVVDIILNLKQARFKVTTDFEEPVKLEIKAKGEKQITAKDFSKVSGIEISNPDLVIATLTEKSAEFNLEVWIEKGRGYLPTEMMSTEEKEIGMIVIDAIFTPVVKVSIDTENVRVGDVTNWDRLILDIDTDGTTSCEDVLNTAAKILVDQFSFFLNESSIEKEEPARNASHSDAGGEKAEEEKENKEEKEKEEAPVEAEDEEDKPKKRGRPKK